MLEDHCYIAGDFNIHLEAIDNLVSKTSDSEKRSEKVHFTNVVSFLRLPSDTGFCQLVKGSTYIQSGTLNFVISQTLNTP